MVIFFKWRTQFVSIWFAGRLARWRKMSAVPRRGVYIKVFGGIVVVKIIKEPVVLLLVEFRGHRPNNLRRLVVCKGMRAEPCGVQTVFSVLLVQYTLAELFTFFKHGLSDIGCCIKVEPFQQGRRAGLTESALFSVKRFLLRQFLYGRFEQCFNMRECFLVCFAGKGLSFQRFKNRQSSEVVETAQVEKCDKRIQLIHIFLFV